MMRADDGAKANVAVSRLRPVADVSDGEKYFWATPAAELGQPQPGLQPL